MGNPDKNERPTPRTDAAVKNMVDKGMALTFPVNVALTLARQLERELAEATRLLAGTLAMTDRVTAEAWAAQDRSAVSATATLKCECYGNAKQCVEKGCRMAGECQAPPSHVEPMQPLIDKAVEIYDRYAPSSTARRQGHSALRVRDGELERYDPNPPHDVDAAAKAWMQRVQVLPVLPPNAEEGFKAGAAWARSATVPTTRTDEEAFSAGWDAARAASLRAVVVPREILNAAACAVNRDRWAMSQEGDEDGEKAMIELHDQLSRLLLAHFSAPTDGRTASHG